MIRDFVYVSALLLTNESPLFKALLRDAVTADELTAGKRRAKKGKEVTASSQRAPKDLKELVFGVSYGTIQTWVKDKRCPEPATLKTIVDSFNEFRSRHSIAKEKSEAFVYEELLSFFEESTEDDESRRSGYDAVWFEFAMKLGYRKDQWRDVQHDIEAVFYQHSLRGHESSCNRDTARKIYTDIGGLNYLYFVSIAPLAHHSGDELRETPYLVRATLRIRKAVNAAKLKNVFYVPCRLKFPIPNENGDNWDTVEYVGKVTYKKRFYYFSLLDNTTRDSDYVQIMIDSKKLVPHTYGGIYATISCEPKIPYSSAAVLENKEHLISKEDSDDRYTTLDFMYMNSARFLPKADEHPSSLVRSVPSYSDLPEEADLQDQLKALTNSKKKIIQELLKDSPFRVSLESFRKDAIATTTTLAPDA